MYRLHLIQININIIIFNNVNWAAHQIKDIKAPTSNITMRR